MDNILKIYLKGRERKPIHQGGSCLKQKSFIEKRIVLLFLNIY